MERVYIGFGSNLGNSEKICSEAVDLLGRQTGILLLAVSSLYRTEPVGVTDQNWFINGVAIYETDIEPEGVLQLTQSIEAQFGRVRTTRWGPRTLDLDILLFGKRRMDLPHLTIPHPRLHERRFVLAPLVEVAPREVHPELGLTMRELLNRLPAENQQVKQYGMP